MSQAESKAKDSAVVGEGMKPGKEPGKEPGNGSPPLTVTNSRGIQVPAFVPSHGHGLLAPGSNKGMPNPNAGRPAEKVRRDATDSLAQHVGKLGAMLGKTLDAASDSLDKGKLHDAMAALNQASRAAATLTSIGPGTKVTNVVEREGYHDAAARAYDSHDGTRLGFLEALKRELDAIP